MHIAPDTRTAPLALWRIAEAFLALLHNLFGAPEEVAARHTLTRRAHALMLSWLRVGEALLRRLLLIEAAAVELSPASTPRPHMHERVRRLAAFSADAPEQWRVSFRCFAPQTSRAARGNEGRKRDRRFLSAWPLAERYEAMIRVFNAPIAYARRLARRLRAEPKQLAAVLRAPPEFAHRVDGAAQLNDAAERAWRKPDSS